MSIMKDSFSNFLTSIREDRKFTIRQMAERLNLSPAYYNDVEKGRRNPLALDKLEIFADIMHLTNEEKVIMFDLAGKSRSEVAPDLPGYIMERDYVSAALRTARDLGADQDDWDAFVADLKRRKG